MIEFIEKQLYHLATVSAKPEYPITTLVMDNGKLLCVEIALLAKSILLHIIQLPTKPFAWGAKKLFGSNCCIEFYKKYPDHLGVEGQKILMLAGGILVTLFIGTFDPATNLDYWIQMELIKDKRPRQLSPEEQFQLDLDNAIEATRPKEVGSTGLGLTSEYDSKRQAEEDARRVGQVGQVSQREPIESEKYTCGSFYGEADESVSGRAVDRKVPPEKSAKEEFLTPKNGFFEFSEDSDNISRQYQQYAHVSVAHFEVIQAAKAKAEKDRLNSET
ncbi:MAG: hypothetical protein H0X51_04660 [Parachlamydiaceae bacterium]|nr:hypothetical protein [Parachlamydiaceae bacterium]